MGMARRLGLLLRLADVANGEPCNVIELLGSAGAFVVAPRRVEFSRYGRRDNQAARATGCCHSTSR
jgi:hypothetical protein